VGVGLSKVAQVLVLTWTSIYHFIKARSICKNATKKKLNVSEYSQSPHPMILKLEFSTPGPTSPGLPHVTSGHFPQHGTQRDEEWWRAEKGRLLLGVGMPQKKAPQPTFGTPKGALGLSRQRTWGTGPKVCIVK
jgi:hypothetical protein